MYEYYNCIYVCLIGGFRRKWGLFAQQIIESV